MTYSTEPRDRIYLKGYGFLSFDKNIGKILSNKYGQKLLDSAKKSTADAIKTASKRAIHKTAEATGDLIGNKIVDKITGVSKKKSTTELHSKELHKKDVPKGCIFLKIIDELMLKLKNKHIFRKRTTSY